MSFESLESRIALSVANDHAPLYVAPHAAPPAALTFQAQAVVAAPVVSASSVSLSQSAERITLYGTGFDRRPGHNAVAFDGGVTGRIVSASPTTLVVQLTHRPATPGILSATVTTNSRSSGDPVAVARIVAAPQVTPDLNALSRSAVTLTIRGSGFDAANLTNRVALTGGATGTVTAATATTLTVALRNLHAAGSPLKAVVTSFGGTSGTAVTIATIVRKATVQSSTQRIQRSDTTLLIRGSGFNPVAASNTVTFNHGAVGRVMTATPTLLVVKLTTPPAAGRLTAVVTAYSGSSGAPVRVATVQASPVVTGNNTSLATDAPTLIITGSGFSTTPRDNLITLSSGSGMVTAATSTQLTVEFTTAPTIGSLTAVVVNNSTSSAPSSGNPVQVATIVAAPTVTSGSGNLANSATTLTIAGSGFNASNASANTVAFSLGAVGTVAAATPTMLTVTLSTPPTSLGSLTAIVTSNSGTSGSAVQVATVVAAPTVVENLTDLVNNQTTVTITGTGFNSSDLSGNTVAFNLGAAGSVTAATSTSLTVAFSTLPTSLGALTAVVTSYGGPSASPVNVATVVAPPTVTATSSNLAVDAPTLVITGTGFSTTPANNVVMLSSGAATVTTATATQLTLTFGDQPAAGTLTAEVLSSSDGEIFIASGTAVQVATVVAAPTVTQSLANQASNVTTVTITGTGFNATTPSANTVVFNLGAVGAVTAATSTQLTVTLSTQPSSNGGLTAVVTSNGGSSGNPVQVNTVVAVPTVSESSTSLAALGSYMTIAGTGFDAFTPSNNTVAFNLGAVGTVMAATSTSLTIQFSTLPTTSGSLTAIVTTDGGSSGTAVQVGTVTYDNFVVSSSTAPAWTTFMDIYGYFPAGYTYSSPDGLINAADASQGVLGYTAASLPSVGSAVNVEVVQRDTVYPYTEKTITAQVATSAPLVDSSTQTLSPTSTTLTITGAKFDTTASNNTVAFNMGAVGFVASATSNSLDVVLTAVPTTSGPLLAVVTTDGVSVNAVQVGTFYATPVVTQSTGSLPFNATTVTINGFGFDPNAGNNTVAFNLGAVGVVTAATGASLTVTFSTPPTSLGTLTAIVTSDGYQAAGAVQVATVVPAVTPSTTPLTVYSTSLTISGSGFDASTPANNTVALTLQGTSIPATVTAATSTSLTITCSPPSSLTGTSGILTAVVTTDGYSSGSTQVATVYAPPSLLAGEPGLYYGSFPSTYTLQGSFPDPNPADYSVTFSNGAAGYVSQVLSSTELQITFTTNPTQLGPMGVALMMDGAPAQNNGFYFVVCPDLVECGFSCSPSSINMWEYNSTSSGPGTPTSSTIVVTVTPTDENGNLLTSGASNLTPYLSIDWTWSIVGNDGSLGSLGPITYNASTGSYEQTFYPNWTLYTNSIFPGDSAFFTFYGYFDGQTGGTLNGNIRCYVYMYETQ